MSKKTNDSELESILNEINGQINSLNKNSGDKKIEVISVEDVDVPEKKSEKNEIKTEKSITEAVTKDDLENEKTKKSQSKRPIKVVDESESNEAVDEKIEDSKSTNSNTASRKKLSKRQKRTVVIGLIVTVFTIIGIVATVLGGIKLSVNIATQSAKKDEFKKIVYPLVIVDTPEFDSVASLDNNVILSSSIWAFIIDDNDKSIYEKDDMGAITVPDVDIEKYIRKLFGPNASFVHQSLDTSSLFVSYDQAAKSYIIDPTPKFLPSTPRIDKLSKGKDNVFTVDVSYIIPNILWSLDNQQTAGQVSKSMQYQIKYNKGEYQILSAKITTVMTPETVSSATDTKDELNDTQSNSNDNLDSLPENSATASE